MFECAALVVVVVVVEEKCFEPVALAFVECGV